MRKMGLKKTFLFNEHKKLKGRMAAFSNWLMPIQYTGIINEHHWTRHSCSLFDTCHMGELIVYGNLKESNLDEILTCNLGSMKIGKCSYGFMLNEKGGIIDDLVIYKLAEDKWMLVVNAGPLTKDVSHLRKFIKTELENVSKNIVKLDLQGPLSRDVLKSILGTQGEKIERLKHYHFDYFSLLGEKIIISRTGYTGELGYELYIKRNKGEELWKLLLSDKRVKPAGLGSRDILRLEVCYPLYGEDITENTTPLEADLERFVYFKKEFIGKSSLLKQKKEGVKRKLVAFRTNSRRAPRHNYKIYADGKEIGFVTSGTFSPILSCGIGMGYIKSDYIKSDKNILIKGEKIEIEAVITKKPFYRNTLLKK